MAWQIDFKKCRKYYIEKQVIWQRKRGVYKKLRHFGKSELSTSRRGIFCFFSRKGRFINNLGGIFCFLSRKRRFINNGIPGIRNFSPLTPTTFSNALPFLTVYIWVLLYFILIFVGIFICSGILRLYTKRLPDNWINYPTAAFIYFWLFPDCRIPDISRTVT